jgi:hypothetical protein
VLARRTREVHGEPRIVADPPLIVPVEDLDPLFLQVKEAQASVLERYVGQNERDYDAFTAAVNSGRLTAQTGL